MGTSGTSSPNSFRRIILFGLIALAACYAAILAALAFAHEKERKAFKQLEPISRNPRLTSPPPMLSLLASPLRLVYPDGLKRVEHLDIWAKTSGHADRLQHLSSLRGLKKIGLRLQNSMDLEGLRGLEVDQLALNWNTEWGNLDALDGIPITDLTITGDLPENFRLPASLPLTSLNMQRRPPSDLSFLKDIPLKQIKLGGKQNQFDTEAFVQLGSMPSLTHLEMFCDRYSEEGLSALAKSKSLQILELDGGAIPSVEDLAGMPALYSLDITSGPNDLAPLAHTPNLGMLQFGFCPNSALHTLSGASSLHSLWLGEGEDAGLSAALAGLPHLGSLVAEFELSTTTIDALRKRGIAISHDGVKDYTLSADYLFFLDQFWAVDLPASAIVPVVDADTGNLLLSVEVETQDPYGSDTCEHPTAESPQFKFPPPLSSDLSSRISTNVVDREWGGTYYCVHDSTSSNKMEWVAFDTTSSTLHLHWAFALNPDEQADHFLDVRLPLTTIAVESFVGPLSLENARQVLAPHIPTHTFHYETRVSEQRIEFTP